MRLIVGSNAEGSCAYSPKALRLFNIMFISCIMRIIKILINIYNTFNAHNELIHIIHLMHIIHIIDLTVFIHEHNSCMLITMLS